MVWNWRLSAVASMLTDPAKAPKRFIVDNKRTSTTLRYTDLEYNVQ